MRRPAEDWTTQIAWWSWGSRSTPSDMSSDIRQRLSTWWGVPGNYYCTDLSIFWGGTQIDWCSKWFWYSIRQTGRLAYCVTPPPHHLQLMDLDKSHCLSLESIIPVGRCELEVNYSITPTILTNIHPANTIHNHVPDTPETNLDPNTHMNERWSAPPVIPNTDTHTDYRLTVTTVIPRSENNQ